jgi:hypothetical protein
MNSLLAGIANENMLTTCNHLNKIHSRCIPMSSCVSCNLCYSASLVSVAFNSYWKIYNQVTSVPCIHIIWDMTPCYWASGFWWLSEGMRLHHQGPTDHRILGTPWHLDTQHHIKTFWLDTQLNIGTSWHSNTQHYIGDLLTWHSVILGPLDTVTHSIILGTS